MQASEKVNDPGFDPYGGGESTVEKLQKSNSTGMQMLIFIHPFNTALDFRVAYVEKVALNVICARSVRMICYHIGYTPLGLV